MLRLLVVPLLLVLAPASCTPPHTETPVESYLAFLRAAQKGDPAAAYALLSEPTKQALQARARQVSEASGGAIKPDPAASFLAYGARLPPPSEVKLLREEGDTAVLQVSHDQRSTAVVMVKEAGGWKLDLTAALNR